MSHHFRLFVVGVWLWLSCCSVDAGAIPSRWPDGSTVPHTDLGRGSTSAAELFPVISEVVSSGQGLVEISTAQQWAAFVQVANKTFEDLDFTTETAVVAWDDCNAFGVTPVSLDGFVDYSISSTLKLCLGRNETVAWQALKVPAAVPQPQFGPGDCSHDGLTNAADLACVSTVDNRDIVLNVLGSVPGDLDGDGDVAFDDFLRLSANFSAEFASYTDGNIDLRNGVDFTDFLILSSNFGAKPNDVAAVPEPNGCAIVLVGCVALMGFRPKNL